ncbi:Expansin-B3 [Platanthera guangdongensis]|uniref:Expansin-B3 n=1 Tax=Platanthera guangdongensis TaxID=2320717 RepID=A0ABR2MSJ7_9ASPA
MKHLWGANWCIIGGPFLREGDYTFDAEFSLGKRCNSQELISKSNIHFATQFHLI